MCTAVLNDLHDQHKYNAYNYPLYLHVPVERSTVPRKETTEESVAKIPLPPPPPPIPTAPPTPHIPPPPPTPRLPDFLAVDGGGEGVASELNEQRDLLQKMQHRLRTRMKKKGGVQTVHTKTNLTVNLDVKVHACT